MTPSGYTFNNGRFYYQNEPVDLTDNHYFEDVSFTIGYHCLRQQWVSYYSFMPDYYIEKYHHVQSGLNFVPEGKQQRLGLWSHLLTNKSYQVFYGDLYLFIIEGIAQETYKKIMLANVAYEMDTRRYISEVDYKQLRHPGFDEVHIYNNLNNSGRLVLVPAEVNNLALDVIYPKMTTDNTAMEILIYEQYGRWRFNYFFNRMLEGKDDESPWVIDRNDIMKEVNQDAISWFQPWQDRMKGDCFLERFANNSESRYKMLVKWFFNTDKRINI